MKKVAVGLATGFAALGDSLGRSVVMALSLQAMEMSSSDAPTKAEQDRMVMLRGG
jgi:hypothetical protein